MEGIPSLEPPQGADWLSELPEDLQWTMLGFLDLPALYTARLVCRRFRKFGAGHFKALDCTTLDGLLTTDFTQFSSMTYLAVTVPHESHLQSLAHPRIAPVVTHVSLKGSHLGDTQAAEVLAGVLMRLPKLRSVSLQPLRGDSCLPLFPPTLEELQITDRDGLYFPHLIGVGDASPLTRCSQLTSLAIDLLLGAGSSVGGLSSLCNLRSLDLCSCSSALGLLSTFTALTSLTFMERGSGEYGSIFQDLGRLTGLSRLALSRILTPGVVTHEELASIAQLTNLTCLDMSGCMLANSVGQSTALAPLTRLVAVRFPGEGRMPQLSVPQVEALQSLNLWDVSDASLLLRATRLTHLDVLCSVPTAALSRQVLCTALASMSMLRSLTLHIHIDWEDDDLGDPDPGAVFRLDAILPACTMLTRLEYRWGELRPDSDLKACAALPGLRSLSFTGSIQLTRASLPALQAMSGLTELSLNSTRIRLADMTPDVIAAFDAERRQLGWPLLKLRVQEMGGRRLERLTMN